MIPLTPSTTRQLLEQLGHHPRRQLGQNFLIDGNIVRKSLEMAELVETDRVVEIGPGLGTLTQALLQTTVAEIFAVELDPRLATHIRETLAIDPRLKLKEADAVDFPVGDLDLTSAGRYKIVANLPYAISSPWMDGILDLEHPPVRMVLMLQKEAADRYMAPCKTKQFSPISIFLQSAYDRTQKHTVSHHCFYPAPAVDSLLVSWTLKPKPFYFSASSRKLIRSVFTQRRKQIGSLANQWPELIPWLTYLESQSIPRTTRPEDIPVEYWQQMDASLKRIA
jgi:16S rRNA (adenine1518-N6/adenine1519-N6)-dimethyltransferase